MSNFTPSPLLRRPLIGIAALALAAFAAGCGITNPDNPYGGAKTTPTVSTTTRTNPEPKQEQGGTIPQAAAATQNKLAAGAGGSTQVSALTQYARVWCNWNSGDLLAHEHHLETMSVGGARAQEQVALTSPTENGAHITNACQILSIAQGTGPASGQWVVVTSSTTTAPGQATLPAELHITFANLTTRSGRYVVNQWAPQT